MRYTDGGSSKPSVLTDETTSSSRPVVGIEVVVAHLGLTREQVIAAGDGLKRSVLPAGCRTIDTD